MGETLGNRISSFSVLLIMVALSFVGIVSLPLLRLSYTPSPKTHTLTVYYSYPGASPQTAENEVNSKIEGILASLAGCEATSSVSYMGGGSASVNISSKIDIAKSRLELSSALRNLWNTLPEGVSYPEISLNARGKNSGTTISYTIKSSLPSMEIEEYASKNVLPFISAIKGIETASLTGATPYLYEICYNAPLCRSFNISSSEIISAIRNNYGILYLGYTEDESLLIPIALNCKAEGIENIPIKKVGEKIIRLGEIAQCSYKEAEASSYYRVNGLNTINLVISLTEDSNLITTTDAIKKEMHRLSESFPQELSANISYDASEYIKAELKKIFFRIGLCVLILLLFVYLAYRSIKYLLIIIFTLFINILSSLSVYAFLGIDINIYTLAGITVALGIVIDSSIVMIDHYRRYHDRKVFFSLLSAILTDVIALLLVFILPESETINLSDFIWAIVLNLCISLCVAVLFIPALMEYLPLSDTKSEEKNHFYSKAYCKYICWAARHKWIFILVILCTTALSFIPFYRNIDKLSFYRQPENKVLHIKASMGEECSILQLNEVIKSMENYLSGFDQIKSYITHIDSKPSATIDVTFFPKWENTSFPAELQSKVTSMAIDFGGANWQVYGITENSFNNNISTYNKSQRITLSGYNYDALLDYASKLTDYLSRNNRVSEPEIWSASWSGAPKTELIWKYNMENMALYDISPSVFHTSLTESLFKRNIGNLPILDKTVETILVSSDYDDYDLWTLSQKLSSLGKIEKSKSNLNIYKYNQSYVVNVCYDFIGTYEFAKKIAESATNYMNTQVLPLGYEAKTPEYYRFDQNKKHYGWLIAVIITALFIMLCAAFESIRLPFAVILTIPVSFIGPFLIFAFSNFTFDQGGFAALVMLCALTINAGIYLICLYNSIKRVNNSAITNYITAFSYKIKPILLTIVSTILGLVPFLTDGPEEVFWFDFALGTISGMLLSLIAVIFVLPAFVIKRNEARHNARPQE